MTMRIKKLHGIHYGTRYSISVILTGDTVNGVVLKGKPCSDVKAIVEQLHNVAGSAPENVIDPIKLAMAMNNEFVKEEDL